MFPGPASLNAGVNERRTAAAASTATAASAVPPRHGGLSRGQRDPSRCPQPPSRRDPPQCTPGTDEPCTAVPPAAPRRAPTAPPRTAPRRRAARAGPLPLPGLSGSPGRPCPPPRGMGSGGPDGVSDCLAAEPPGAGPAHLVVVKNNLFPSPFGEGEGENHSRGGEGQGEKGERGREQAREKHQTKQKTRAPNYWDTERGAWRRLAARCEWERDGPRERTGPG